MADKVRVGFIGCGGIANYHFGHFENIETAQITAVCDRVDERVQKTSARFSATPYKDFHEMLDREKLDAVYVCVEPCAHERDGDNIELAVIDKGHHLFVEKPPALTMGYARQVLAGIEKKNLISAVGFQDRYQDIVPRMKAWLDMQEIGFFNGYWVGGMPGVWWWRRRETSGGQAVEQTIHTFDMARCLFGDVVAVNAMGRRGIMTDVENYDTEDASGVTMTFANGVIGTIYSGCFSRFAGKNGIDVFCKTGRLEYTERRGFKVLESNMTIEAKTGNDFGQEEDDVFIEAVRTGDASEILAPYSEAIKSLEVTLAANESMDAGGKLITLG